MEFSFIRTNFDLAHKNLDYLMEGRLNITLAQQKAVRAAFDKYFLALIPRQQSARDANKNAGLKCADMLNQIMILCIPADYVEQRGCVGSIKMKKHIASARSLKQRRSAI